MQNELTCTKLIKSTITKAGCRLGKDNEGRQQYETRRCAAPAAEHEIGGLLTKAKAILCDHHKKMADREDKWHTEGGEQPAQGEPTMSNVMYEDPQPKCELCGQPMPLGEEMFKYHGHSGPCPKPRREQPAQGEPPLEHTSTCMDDRGNCCATPEGAVEGMSAEQFKHHEFSARNIGGRWAGRMGYELAREIEAFAEAYAALKVRESTDAKEMWIAEYERARQRFVKAEAELAKLREERDAQVKAMELSSIHWRMRAERAESALREARSKAEKLCGMLEDDGYTGANIVGQTLNELLVLLKP